MKLKAIINKNKIGWGLFYVGREKGYFHLIPHYELPALNLNSDEKATMYLKQNLSDRLNMPINSFEFEFIETEKYEIRKIMDGLQKELIENEIIELKK